MARLSVGVMDTVKSAAAHLNLVMLLIGAVAMNIITLVTSADILKCLRR